MTATRRSDGPKELSRVFWENAACGRLFAQYDIVAKRYQFYPRPLGNFSGASKLEWRQCSGTGTIAAITTVRSAPPEFIDKAPYRIAIIRLVEGFEIVAPLVGDGSDTATIGSPVHFVGPGDCDGAFPFAFAVAHREPVHRDSARARD